MVAAIVMSQAACSKKKPAPAAPKAPVTGAVETGIASWYGHPYHGRRAANGEVFDMEKMTAAHRTLAFGTKVLVTNRNNGLTVEVRINDRGPFIDGRIIDLSRAAAESIQMIGPGTAPVSVRVIGYGPVQGMGAFGVQAGLFREKARAEALVKRLERNYQPVRMVKREGGGDAWRVIVGDKSTREEADVLAASLRREVEGAFVVRLD